MHHQVYFPLKDNPHHSHILVVVNKDDTRKSAVVYVTPLRRDDTGIEFFQIGKGRSKILEPMSRRNAKRLDELLQEVKHQVRERKGNIWDVVARVLIENNVELKEET